MIPINLFPLQMFLFLVDWPISFELQRTEMGQNTRDKSERRTFENPFVADDNHSFVFFFPFPFHGRANQHVSTMSMFPFSSVLLLLLFFLNPQTCHKLSELLLVQRFLQRTSWSKPNYFAFTSNEQCNKL